MKKIFLSFSLALGTLFSTNATTLVIENQCQNYVCIYMITTTTINGVCYTYVADENNQCGININPNDSYHITDGNPGNVQFPFLNEPPLSGNVLVGPGITDDLLPASLPLPPIGDWNSTDRYKFEYMKFTVKGAYGEGFGIYPNPFDYPNYPIDVPNFIPEETYDYVAFPGEQYMVDYVSFFGNYYFLFEDTL